MMSIRGFGRCFLAGRTTSFLKTAALFSFGLSGSQARIAAEAGRHIGRWLYLLDAVDGPFKARDYCMITLFLNCGMRLSELVGINITDIKDDLLTVTGKGNKQRTLFLNQMCRDAIEDYKAVRPVEGVKDREALFLSRLGRRISTKTVQHVVYTALDRAGLGGKHLSVHKLRHTAATLMYQNGADVRVLKDVLGHENLNTTQIYTHVRDEQVQAAMESNPLGKVKRRADKKKQNENGEE